MRRRPFRVAVLVGLVAYAALAWRFRFTCDDAYITFRYARHLAEGVGPRFNPGEAPPVEGYSNFLWTLLLSLPSRLGLALEPAANSASFASGGVLLWLTARFTVERLGLCPVGAGATTLFLATLPPLSVWATGGLETMPFALAVFATFAGLARAPQAPRIGPAALAAACAALLRADGPLFVALALGAAAASGARARDLLRPLLAVVAVTLAHALWRHGYYGEWLPNTARVKAGFSATRLERGWGYLASLALAVPALALVPPAATLAGRGAPRRVGLAAAGFVLVNAGYAVFIGGDFMAMGRLLVPSLPFLALAFAAASRAWRPVARLSFAAVLVVAGLLGNFDLLGVPASWRQAVHFRWNTETARSEVEQWDEMRANGLELAFLGRALERFTSPGESMIRSSVGAVGYFTELELFDRNGLVSPEVVDGSPPLERASPGHDRRVEPDFFLDRRPTYYGAKLLRPPDPGGGGPALGREAQALVAAGRLAVELHPLPVDLLEPPDSLGPLPAAARLPQGTALQLLRLRWGETR